MIRMLTLAALAGLAFAAPARALDPAQAALVKGYMAEAPGDAARGKAFFFAPHAGGKPDTPSCTSCHTQNLAGRGATKAGKPIEPMAASANPKRYTDRAEVEKRFKRNCADVLGRACTAQEKSDLLAFLTSL